VNGKVLTVDDQFSIAGGFAVESGRFVAVGDSAGIQKLADGTAFQDIPRWRRCSRDTPGFMELFCNMPRSPGLPMWG
jgi:hypothetical protein